MSKFIKKAVIIEATQWFENGDHPEDGCELITPADGEGFRSEGKVVRYYRHPDGHGHVECRHCGYMMHGHGWIETLESGPFGGHIVCPGDWIITGVKGERYPCKPDIFALTYDVLHEAPASVEENLPLPL